MTCNCNVHRFDWCQRSCIFCIEYLMCSLLVCVTFYLKFTFSFFSCNCQKNDCKLTLSRKLLLQKRTSQNNEWKINIIESFKRSFLMKKNQITEKFRNGIRNWCQNVKTKIDYNLHDLQLFYVFTTRDQFHLSVEHITFYIELF